MRTSYLVGQILRDVPRTRDSDKELIIEFLERRGFSFTDHQRQIFKDINMESIRRIRQKIQEDKFVDGVLVKEGRYKASEHIKKSRDMKAMVIQQNAPKSEEKRLETLFNIDDYTIEKRRTEF
jgi:hypothetical protein